MDFVQEILNREEHHIIAPLIVSDDPKYIKSKSEFLKKTILDEWLKYETWTAAEGALIVNGWLPPAGGCQAIPTSGLQMRLSGERLSFAACSFTFAKKILSRWEKRSEYEPDGRVSPPDWLQWCRDNAEDFEAPWLVAVENALKVKDAKVDKYPTEASTCKNGPDYYRLGKLAEDLGLGVDDLLDYGEEGQLEICVRLKKCVTAKKYSHVYTDDGGMYCNISLRPEFLSEHIFKLNHSRIYDLRNGEPLKSVYVEDGGRDWTEFKLSEPLQLTLSSPFLVVTMSEKERFVSFFENLNDQLVDNNHQDVKSDIEPDETDEDMVARLRVEGKIDDEIIFEMWDRTSPAKLGELVFEEVEHREGPTRVKERDAYRKRAERAYNREKKKRGL